MTAGASIASTEAEQTPARRHLALVRSYLATEAGGAIVLLLATIAALVWANSPWADGYDAFWQTELSLRVGDFALSHDLQDWVNDGLMTLFFVLIGLEVRREFDMGEFRERRRVAAPVIAAFGGMALPVIIFLAFNPSSEASRGWAMVMATDTAFAVGVLALVGRRSSFRLRTFLLTLVIVDDVAAVIVIAVVYTTDVNLAALAAAVLLLAAIGVLRARGVERSEVYLLLGLGAWLASSTAGVHPTVAGVAIGLLTSAYPPTRASLEEATGTAHAFRQRPTPDLAQIAARRITMAVSPNERLQHALHPWSSFVIVPLFALANAGLDLSPELLGGALQSPLVIGIIAGLVVGKTVGISSGAWLASRPWLGGSPLAVGWPSIVAASSVAGIGFTMSLLIAELSYTEPLLDEAKLGILAASTVAAALSLILFHAVAALPRDLLRRAEERTAPPLPDLSEPVDPTRDHIRGASDAPVTLLEYGDYECPYCGRAAPAVKALLDRFDGQVRFVFRHLPLSDVHPHAALAAEAAEAAGAQDAFWAMHDVLFANQDALQPADLLSYAAELGLDAQQFERDLRASRFTPRVAQDVNSAEEAGVAGTPTFFIDEVLYRGRNDRVALEEALARAVSAWRERTFEDVA
ncbi:MAG TPA: Na+/H+ antiporter NhaA [Candidatus Limnocylindria bacterium]|nr:Na+/H+ antiporter NhaA [Candidatus Limnocylindria bacterium]